MTKHPPSARIVERNSVTDMRMLHDKKKVKIYFEQNYQNWRGFSDHSVMSEYFFVSCFMQP